MGCLFTIVRSVLSLVFGVSVFFGFLFLVLVDDVSDKLLDADFYIDTIDGQNTYDRIYDEVLLDSELEETTRDLLGDIDVSQGDIVGILRQIVTPEYLRSQVNDAIHRTVDYFNEDVERLELYVELGPPLENSKVVLFDYIDRRIDGLAEEDLGRFECTPQRVTEVSDLYRDRWQELSDGTVPVSIPSLRSFDALCRLAIFELTFDRVVDQSGLDARVVQGLRASRQDLQRQFVAGDAREVLKLAARPLATPLMDDAIEEVTKDLDSNDRLDLIQRLAAWNDDFTEADIRSDIDKTRDWIVRGRTSGRSVALLLLIGGAVLLGLIHLPSLKNVLRWPGVSLFSTGLIFFVGAKVAQSIVPDRLQELVEREADQVAGVPSSVTSLGGDLLISFGRQLTQGFEGIALTLLIIGAILVVASFFVFLLRPIIPWVR